MKYPLFLTAFTALVLVQPAQAADPLSFYPSQGWTVSDTCNASTVYSNGYILGLSKDGMLTIDFRQPVFTSGQSYPVAMRAGAQSYNVQATAQSTNILSMNLAAHSGLPEALTTNSSFTSDIEGNVFRFFTTGLVSQLGSLKSCGQPDRATVESASLADSVQTTEALPVNEFEEAEIAAEAAPIPRAAEVPDVMPPMQESNQHSIATLDQMERVSASDMPASTARANAPAVEKAVQPRIVSSEPSIFTPEPVSARVTPEATRSSSVSDFTPAPKVDTSRYTDQISSLNQRLSSLEKENELLKTASVGESTFETADWNLEKATMRFQEAERQLKDMGQKLQKERAQCKLEKQELEAMLFDPQITQERQIAELAALEDENARLQEEIVSQRMRYEERIKALEGQR
jgi:hypothetical protein